MKLIDIRNVLTSKVGRQILTVQKHSPAILFVAGTVGVVATAVLAARATLKLEEVLESVETDKGKTEQAMLVEGYDENDKRKDTVLIYTKATMKIAGLYAPALAVGALSIAALTGSHVILTRRNVALTAAYAALEKGFNEYRKRVTDELGADKDKQFRYGLVDKEYVEETKEGPVVKTMKVVPDNGRSIYAACFDEKSINWKREPMYNQLFIQCQQNYANDLLRSRGHIFLNEVYDMLGLERSKAGSVVGWIWSDCEGGDNFVDFGVFEGNEWKALQFVNGDERSIWLDFNVDGVIYDKI